MKWYTHLTIKDQLTTTTTKEVIIKLNMILTHELKRIMKVVDGSRVINKDCGIHYGQDHFIDEIDDIIGNIEHLSNLATGKIPRCDWDDYHFDGDFEDEFNNIMDQVRELGNTHINDSTKFIWIK